MTRALNEAALSLIQKYEGFISKWYPDPVHGWKVPTCCYGHTDAAGPPFYKDGKNKKFTRAEGAEILARDLRSYADAVEKAVKVPLTDNQFGALVSFTYNLGPGNLRKSTLLKKLNAGDVAGAANAFLSWNKAAGKVMKGLTTRREAERKLFLSKSGNAPKPAAPVPNHVGGVTDMIAKPEPIRTDSTLRRGSYGPIVGDLQRNLNTLGYGPLKVDDHFGADTERAVVAFQIDHGLKEDGIAGGRTNTAIGKAIKDRETAPKIAAATEVVDDAAGKGLSKTEVITTVTGVGGVATVVKETVDSVKDGATSLLSLGPWILLAFVIAAGAGYVIWERRRKRIAANAAKAVM